MREKTVRGWLVWDSTLWHMEWEVKGTEEYGVRYPLSVTQPRNMAHPAQYQRYQVMCTMWLPVVFCTVIPTKLLDTSISQKDRVWFLPVPSHCSCIILVKWLSRLAEGYVICGFLWLGWLLNICLIMFFFFLVTFFHLKLNCNVCSWKAALES